MHTTVAGDVARGQRAFVRQRHAVPGAAPGPQAGGRGRVLLRHVSRGRVADGGMVAGAVHPRRRAAGRVTGARPGRPATAATHQLAGLHHPAHFYAGKRTRSE